MAAARFGLSLAVTGAVFFWAGVCSAFSALVAVRIAPRIGLVRTMVFTHLPANGLLILAAFMPTAPLAVACLLARRAVADGRAGPDVVRDGGRLARRAPGRGERHQRAAQPGRGAAADRRRVDARRSRRSAGRWSSPASLKAIYDLLLLAQFRDVRPPEEVAGAAPGRAG